MRNPAKVALITGAARRLGAAIVRQLHEAGYQVALHYRYSREEAEQLCSSLNQSRPRSAILLSLELRETAGLAYLIEQTVEAWGRLDVLVNNASGFQKTILGEVQEEAWDALMDANLKAPFFLAQAAYRYLAKTQGCILNLTDIHTERPFRDYAVYCISKAGLVALTRILAKEMGPRIRVNAISPGMMILPEGENALSEPIRQKLIEEAALKRMGSPEDIAKAVLFLARDADYITGQVLAVDGGRLL